MVGNGGRQCHAANTLASKKLAKEASWIASVRSGTLTFEDYIKTQIDLRSEVSVKLGTKADGSSASLMTWSDKSEGTHFWDVAGDTIKHLAFVGSDD